MGRDISISLITLTCNKLGYTRCCFPRYLRSSAPSWEWIVVDNGSQDGTAEWLSEFQRVAARQGVPLTIVANPVNRGCSTARNQGLRRARGERLVFADNDVTPRTGPWMERLAAELDSDPRVGLVGPKLVYPRPPFDIQCAGVGISRGGRVHFLGRGQPREHPAFNERREVQALISACFMARRAVMEEIGGFDEAFNPVQFEDLDVCYRARARGWKAVYVPSVEMYHFESATTAGTNGLPNAALVVRHGLLFKQRWRSMFSIEDGPPDEAAPWTWPPPHDPASIEELPLVD